MNLVYLFVSRFLVSPKPLKSTERRASIEWLKMRLALVSINEFD